MNAKQAKWTNLVPEVQKERRSGAGNEEGSAGHERGLRS